MGKKPPANAGDSGLILRLGIGNDNSLHILAWKIHGQRILAGYSSWGCKESDMTEHACTHMHILISKKLSYENLIVILKTCGVFWLINSMLRTCDIF